MTERNLYRNPDPNDAGKPYRPDGGFEGLDFNSLFCCHCKKADLMGMCDIYCDATGYELTDPEYPKEWVYRADGQPTCTAFEEDT